MLTGIKDRKIPSVYIHVYQITKNWGPGPHNSLCHADNRKYFSDLSDARSKGSAHVLLGKISGKIWACFCLMNLFNEFFCLMNSNIVKPEKFGHLHLVYHFTVPLNKYFVLILTFTLIQIWASNLNPFYILDYSILWHGMFSLFGIFFKPHIFNFDWS